MELKRASFLWDKPPEVWKNETDIPTQTEFLKYENRNRQSLSKKSTLRIVLSEFSKLHRGGTEAQLSADYRACDDSLCHDPHEQTGVPSSVPHTARLSGFPHHLTVSYANKSLMKFLFFQWIHLIQPFFWTDVFSWWCWTLQSSDRSALPAFLKFVVNSCLAGFPHPILVL